MEDLRSRQRLMARSAIVEACAGLVTERRHLDFTMKEVADRAGVSLRTVYNHFATREDLLDALGQAFDEQMAAMGGTDVRDLRTAGDLLAAVRVNLGLFDSLDGISEAFAQMPLADVGRDGERMERTRRLVDLMIGLMPNVSPDEARPIAVMLRHLLSHRSWFWLTREYGLDTDQASGVITWAIATLIEAAAGGDLPERTEEP